MRSGFERFIGNDQMMVLFVGTADALEDFNGLLFGWLVHDDGLEAALEGGIRFDVLAVFVQRGGADDLQLAAGKGGLEDVGRVHGGAGRAGTDQHVDFVDKEDGAGLLQLVDDALEAFLELAAVHRTGHQGTNIQLQQTLVHQRRGDIAVHDALGEAFHDGGLAHARFADQGRVVLGAACQDLDDALDLHLAANDRVELLLFGHGSQVGGQLVDQGCFRILRLASAGSRGTGRGRGGGSGLVEHAARLPADLVRRHAESAQDLHGGAIHADQSQ